MPSITDTVRWSNAQRVTLDSQWKPRRREANGFIRGILAAPFIVAAVWALYVLAWAVMG